MPVLQASEMASDYSKQNICWLRYYVIVGMLKSRNVLRDLLA
jgi:hypothetical protein